MKIMKWGMLGISSAALLLLLGCSHEERNGAAVSPPSASAKSDVATKQSAPIPLPDRKVQTVAPNGKCANLHPATDMEDLMRQIVANLDSPCLFAYSPKELEQAWQINPVPDIHAIMFPELNPNDPAYMDKVNREMEKVMTGKRTLDAATAKRVESEMRNMRPRSAVSIGSGTWSSSGTNKEPRQGRYFSINPNNEHKTQYGGFGKGFNRIGELPDFFREHSEHIPANNRYYRHNSRNDPDLPFIEIHYDGTTGKIDYIHVYEKQRDVTRGSGSRH